MIGASITTIFQKIEFIALSVLSKVLQLLVDQQAARLHLTQKQFKCHTFPIHKHSALEVLDFVK